MKKIILFFLFSISNLSHALENSYLFVQGSTTAQIAALDDKYTLTLKKDGDPSYFTDRPKRLAGKIKFSEFLELWRNRTIKNNFIDNPPNAAIVMEDDKNKWHNTIAIVSNPINKDSTISYQIKPIDGKPLPTGNLRHVVLFFDDLRWNPGGI